MCPRFMKGLGDPRVLLPMITYKGTLVQDEKWPPRSTAVLGTVAWLTGRQHGREQTGSLTDPTLSLGTGSRVNLDRCSLYFLYL